MPVKQTPREARVPQGKAVKFLKSDTIFTQGSPAKNAYYIQEGAVKLSATNQAGREAIVAILGPGDFIGEGFLAGEYRCIVTATAIAPTTVCIIEKSEMIRLLHEKREFFERFIAFVLERHVRMQGDLIDQLFNLSEKRLARTLLLLAEVSARGQPKRVVAKISQETLAEMVGTTRSRINFFMNKFRKLGFIQYSDGEIHVNESLLQIVLQN